MKILMYIGNDLIDYVWIEREKITLPGYIAHYIRLLRRKHALIIRQSEDLPEFLVAAQ